MPSNNLQGLNIVHPVPPHGDAQDLLSGPPYPDLSSQLDLWTNLTFDSEESPITREEDKFKKDRADEEDEDDVRSTQTTGETAIHDGHTNVVTGTVVPSTQPPPLNPLGTLHHPPANLSPQLLFDLNTFFTNFGGDPFSAPTFANPHASLTPPLALHSTQNAYGAPIPHHPQQIVAQHPAPAQSVSATSPATTSAKSLPVSRNSTEDANASAPKRARTRKSSISAASPDEATPPPNESSSTGTQGLSAAEDKRRRNTAASARFRLKKKEREAALEGKAKELEIRVNELERECEGLRRENGWLKGLVVGVTGAAQAPVAATPSTIASAQVAPTGNITKRVRDEVDA